MSGAFKLEHVALQTENLERTLANYENRFGMVEIVRTGKTAYLGFGMDGDFDISLREGVAGLDHFAIRIADAEVIEEYEQKLRRVDTTTERVDGSEPGIEQGIRFEMPSGIPMELVTATDRSYHRSANPTSPDRAGTAPLDLHHIGLTTPRIRADTEFLRTTLDFQLSEARGTPEDWSAAWLRRGNMHHDVALLAVDADEELGGLHHVALEMASVDHITRFLDTLAPGIKLEVGIGRHEAGDNIFAYFWMESGHRYELSAEMATVDGAEPEYTTPPTSTWGANVPDTFYEHGTKLVRDEPSGK